MGLAALIADVDPRWHGDDGINDALLQRAHGSALGRRLLVGALAEGPGARLLAPSPEGFAAVVTRWNRARLTALHRDLGVLAYAPAIRAEVGRDAVKRLKAALASSYLLALDRSVWDAKVETSLQGALVSTVALALEAGDGFAPLLHAAFELQGRAELQAWAGQREPALADWAQLVYPPTGLPHSHLPEKPLLVVLTHHQNRAVAA